MKKWFPSITFLLAMQPSQTLDAGKRVITKLDINTVIMNKIYREKSIPMIALWCPAFSNHG